MSNETHNEKTQGEKDSWLYIIFFALLMIDLLIKAKANVHIPFTGLIIFQGLYLLIAHKIHQKLLKKMPLFWSALLSILIGQFIAGFLVGLFG